MCGWIEGGVGTDVMAFSTDARPVARAVILEKTSFFVMVGDEHGLTEGVLFAEIVLLLEARAPMAVIERRTQQ